MNLRTKATAFILAALPVFNVFTALAQQPSILDNSLPLEQIQVGDRLEFHRTMNAILVATTDRQFTSATSHSPTRHFPYLMQFSTLPSHTGCIISGHIPFVLGQGLRYQVTQVAAPASADYSNDVEIDVVPVALRSLHDSAAVELFTVRFLCWSERYTPGVRVAGRPAPSAPRRWSDVRRFFSWQVILRGEPNGRPVWTGAGRQGTSPEK